MVKTDGMAAPALAPLVGRDRETGAIEAHLSTALSGRGSVVLLSGPPGIGKTALARAAQAMAGRAGMAVFVGRAVDTQGVPPLWPWRVVLPDAGAPQAPDRDGGNAPGTPEDAAARQFLAVQHLTVSVVERAGGSAGQATLLVLEDMHWADPLSVILLRSVATVVPEVPLCVLVTHRDARPGGASALGDALPRLHSEASVVAMRLRPLDPAAVGLMLGAVAGEALDPAGLTSVVAEQTGGNPLFVRTVGDLLGHLRPAEREVAAVKQLVSQPELRDLIRARLSSLPAQTCSYLRAASVMGEDFRAGDLAVVAATEPAAILSALEPALDAGAVTYEAKEGVHRFGHSLVREGLYADLSSADRVECHRRVAEWLEAAPAMAEEHAGELATHWLRAALDHNDFRRAAHWARRGALTAQRRQAWETSAGLLFTAVEAAERGRLSSEDFSGLLIEAAEAANRAGMFGRAVELAQRAAGTAATAGHGGLVAAAALVVQGVGDERVNLEVLGLARGALAYEGPPQVRARLLAQQACCLVHLDRPREAIGASLEALRLARTSQDPLAELDALHARHLVVAAPESASERLELANQASRLAEVLDQPGPRLWSTLWQIDGAFELGDLPRVDGLLAGLDLLTAGGPPLGRWHLHRLRSARQALTGDFAGARAEAQQARAVAERLGDPQIVGLFFSFRIMLAMLRDDPAELPADLEPNLAAAPAIPVVQSSRALVELLRGRRAAAESLHAQLVAQLPNLPVSTRWGGVVVMLVHTTEAFADQDAAALLYRLILPAEPFYAAGPSGTVFCLGSYALPLARMAIVQGQWETALVHANRALESNARLEATPFVALAHLAAARAMVGRHGPGDLDEAKYHAAQAAAVSERLDMPGVLVAAHRLLGADATAPSPGELTDREREVAHLVARGLTNRQIANTLFLSERTVESHVRSALQKLGLQRRTQLAARLLSPTEDGAGREAGGTAR